MEALPTLMHEGVTATTETFKHSNSNSTGKVFILHRLLVDGGHITRQVSMFPDVRTQTQTKMFSVFYENTSVDRSSFRSIGSLFRAHGAATEKALSPIHRHVRGMTRLPHDKACIADHVGISATGVSKSEMYSGVCPRSDLWTSTHSLYWTVSATGNQCNSWRAGVTRSCGLRSRTICATAWIHWNGASVEAGRPASTALL